MGNLTSRLTVSLTDDVSGPAKKAGASMKALGASSKDLERLDKIIAFRGLQKSFADARTTFNAAQVSVRKVAQEMAAADAPSRKMQAAYAAAQRAAKSSADAFRQQSSSIKASIASLNAAGVPLSRLTAEENRLRAAIERTTAAASKRNTVVVPRNRALDRIGTGVGAAAGGAAAAVSGYKAKEFGKKAVVSAAEFDIGVRKQREFVDIPKTTQDSVLIPQAKKIGQDTQFSNLDVVKAQTKAMQGLPSTFNADTRAEVGAAIVESVKNYALTMEADLEGSSEAIRTFLQTTNKDISSKEKAVAEATRATNLMVKMAKLGGMNDEDVQQFMKYGAGTATAAGLSDTTLAAIGATGRRGGLRGDELGVFVRAMSSKLVAPTSKGLDALTAAGIDYNKFTTMPGGLSVDNLEGLSKRRFGKGLNDDQRTRLGDILENSEVVSNREDFTKQVSEILAESFTKKKNGETKAQDAQKIAKMVGDFHKLSTESVDAEGLLSAIMTNPKMSIALMNAFLSDKHGGKGSILSQKWGDFGAGKQELDKVGDDPDFAKRKADEIMGGLGGSFERLKGSIENLTLSVGQANEAMLKTGMDKAGNALDSVSNLPPKMMQWGSGILGGAGALGGSLLTRAMLERFGVVGAGSGAAGMAGGLGIGAMVGGAMSDLSTEIMKGGLEGGDPDRIRNMFNNPMLGAMSGDAALAAAILAAPSIELPARPKEDPTAVKTPITDARRKAWNEDRERMNLPQISDPNRGSEDVWSKGTKGVEHLDGSSEAAGAADKTAAAYKAAAEKGLAAVDGVFTAAVARWNGILGGVNASPTITPKIGGIGQQSSLSSANAKHAQYSDGTNFG